MVQIPRLEGITYLMCSFPIISFSFCFAKLFMLLPRVLFPAIGSQGFAYTAFSVPLFALGGPLGGFESLCGHFDSPSGIKSYPWAAVQPTV